MPAKAAAIRAPEEVAHEIKDLSNADMGRLHRIAVHLAKSRTIEADDLLQEAYCRALEGRRNCPSGVDVVKFLADAMSSIADGEVKKAIVRPSFVPVGLSDPPPGEVDPADRRAGADELLVVAELQSQILRLFEDNATAHIMVDGILSGMEREELQELTELDDVAYDSMRRLVRRRIDREIQRGGLHG